MRIFILFIFLFPFVLSAQDRTIDSLKLVFKNAKHDTTRCNILNLMIEAESDDELWPIYNNQLLKLAEKKYKDKVSKKEARFYLKHVASALNNIGYLANQQGNIDSAIVYYQKSLKIQKEINDKEGMAHSFNNIGGLYSDDGKLSEALVLFLDALKIMEELNNKEGIAHSYNIIGFVYNRQGDITNTLEYYHKSLKIQEEINDQRGMALSLNNIGTIYDDQGETKKALECYQHSLKIRESLNDKKGIANSLNNIGHIYDNQGNIEVALDFYNKSLKIREDVDDKYGIASTLNNIGDIYYLKNNLPEALHFFEKSLQINEQIRYKTGIATALTNVANVLIKQGNSKAALNYASHALNVSKEIGYPENILKAAAVLCKIYKSTNKYQNALEMYELKIQMRDSISNTETKKASIKKQFQYEYEKKATADSVKHTEEQKVKNALLTAQNAQLKQEKTQRWALYGGLVLVIAFLGFVFNRFRVTQKQKIIIEQQKKLVDNAFIHLEEKNKEVMDSIHYAKRIQTALLTSEKYIERKLNELNS